MAFSAPSPPPFVPPAPPALLAPMAPVTTAKPPRQAQSPTFISSALSPQAGQAGQRSLIGGIPQALGA